MSLARRWLAGRPWLLGAILLTAFVLRLYGIGFGLPAIYDPDEPMFILSGLRLIAQWTLDPGWFGHPGTTTIYLLSLIDLAIFGVGRLAGVFGSAAGFGVAVYLDPAIVALPSRLVFASFGVAGVALTFLLARRLFDDRVGLIAAALLALNPLHIQYSQIIRTDVHASLFMLLGVLASLEIARRGRLRDHVAAGILIGLATATKWPAATVAAAALGAAALRAIERREDAPRQARLIALTIVLALATLILVSPYLLIDHQRFLDNMHGEARPSHLGATGGGFAANLLWYLVGPMRASVGWLGLALAGIGTIAGGMRSRAWLAVCVFPAGVFLIAIGDQALIWARWIVPLLPFVSVAIAVAVGGIADLGARRYDKRAGMIVASLLLIALAVPMAITVRAGAIERLHDTRALASDWVRRHVPPGRTILVEHFAFDLNGGGWTILFPGGGIGCFDAMRMLRGRVQVATVDGWRQGHAIMDIGTLDPAMLATCRTDFAILSDYDRYRSDPAVFAAPLANYRRFLLDGRIVASFAPSPGANGGPIVRIVELRRGADLAR